MPVYDKIRIYRHFSVQRKHAAKAAHGPRGGQGEMSPLLDYIREKAEENRRKKGENV